MPGFKIKSGLGPSGLHREVNAGDEFELVAKIEAFLKRNDRPRHAQQRLLTGPYEGLRDAMRGARRACDRFLSNPDRYTHPEFIEKSVWQDDQIRNRILVDSEITGAGNLSVKFAPYFLDENGEWTKSPEWKDLQAPTFPGYGERPLFEVLFVRGVEDLMRTETEYAKDVWLEELDLARRAVVAAYRVAVRKLENDFRVQENTYVAGLYEGPARDAERCLGIELVKGHDEHREHVAAAPARFAEATTLDPKSFWEAYRGLAARDDYAASENLSKRLRVKGTPTGGLTPGVIRGWLNELKQAERYGLLAFDPVPGPELSDAPEPSGPK